MSGRTDSLSAASSSASLRASAFEGLLRHATDFVLLLDPQGNILEAGRSFCSSIADGSPKGHRVARYLDRGSIEKFRSAMELVRVGPQAVEVNFVTPDREVRLIHFTLCRASGPEGSPLVVALGRDQEPALAFAERCIRLNRELEEARNELARQAETDPLTGLGNRRWLFGRLEALWNSPTIGDRHLWVMMADLDHFKKINDTHGHQAGDDALKAAALALRNSVRATEIVARYGGEEFVLAGLADDISCVRAVANRLLDAIRARPVPVPGGTISLTVSLGVAVIEPGCPLPPWSVVQVADQALYRAKAAGRDRAEFHRIGRDSAECEGGDLGPAEGGGSRREARFPGRRRDD